MPSILSGVYDGWGTYPRDLRHPILPGRSSAKWEPIGHLRCTKNVKTTREGDRIAVDESAVIARVRSGEPEAYAELVRAHTPIAMRAALALGAGADAEDMVQQAFLKAFYSLGQFRDGSAFRPWLLSIVANETRNTVRSAARRRLVADGESALMEAQPPIPESSDPAIAALAIERKKALVKAMEQLSDDHRMVVTYRYLLEMDEGETAQALGWPRGTVKSRLNRALRKLGGLLPPGLAERGRREGGDGHG